jgi:hypothetical protein
MLIAGIDEVAARAAAGPVAAAVTRASAAHRRLEGLGCR